MSETAAQQTIPAVAAPQAPAAAQPVAQPAQPAAAQPQHGAPVTNVTVNLPPDLLRMAGLQPSAQGAPAAPASVAPPAAPAAPAAPVPAQPEAPKADAAPAAPPAPAQPAAISPDVAALQAQLSAMREQHNATLVRSVVDRVSLTGGAINADVVLKLIRDELDVAADGKVIAKGDPRVSGEQHVARFLAANPYLLKPQVAGGGAGAPPIATAPAAPAAKPDMTTADGATKLARQIAESRGYLRAPQQ